MFAAMGAFSKVVFAAVVANHPFSGLAAQCATRRHAGQDAH
ncbi:hypothetical protein LT85_4556 [Collimonas arenae]|uniref:Uncharacterized protein n=1 Tax=Collimonas arenae TaxID=279058 RepID=A0A0A1FJ88_9BURK|nr:hypothetical protein LT85_4556 [Collimonas arenae]